MRDDLKLSVKDMKFFINPAKKSVTCKLSFDLLAPDSFYAAMWAYNSTTGDDINYSIKATAKTLPTDTWDEEVGCKIARAKAEALMYKRVKKYLFRFAGFQAANSVMAFEMVDKADGVIEHNNKYITKF